LGNIELLTRTHHRTRAHDTRTTGPSAFWASTTRERRTGTAAIVWPLPSPGPAATSLVSARRWAWRASAPSPSPRLGTWSRPSRAPGQSLFHTQ
jgi:hypothetical protein